ncbi:MAG: hypothetical protein AB7V45_04015 [Candidatus Krumholzibacteriia bacterium]
MNTMKFSAMMGMLVLVSSPVLAQHGGMGGMGDHGGGHGDMHGGQMMEGHSGMLEHMDTMMDHMSQMMQQMHESHDQMGLEGHGHGELSAEDPMSDWMMSMEEGMGNMMPHMESMMRSMHVYLDNGESSVGDHHEDMMNVMTNMDRMVEAGRNLMEAMRAMRGEPAPDTNGNHEGHAH